MTRTIEEVIDEHAAPPAGKVSFEEFLAWLDEDVWAEWVDGEITIMSPASDTHQDISDFLITILRLFIRKHRLGWIRSGPFVMRTPIRPSGREPDIMFVRAEHVSIVQRTFLDGPADLVIEIVSPESVQRDRGTKFAEYEAAGVSEYWLLDPLRQEITFYELGADGYYHPGIINADGVYHSSVVQGFWLQVAWLWESPLPDETDVLKELGVL